MYRVNHIEALWQAGKEEEARYFDEVLASEFRPEIELFRQGRISADAEV